MKRAVVLVTLIFISANLFAHDGMSDATYAEVQTWYGKSIKVSHTVGGTLISCSQETGFCKFSHWGTKKINTTHYTNMTLMS